MKFFFLQISLIHLIFAVLFLPAQSRKQLTVEDIYLTLDTTPQLKDKIKWYPDGRALSFTKFDTLNGAELLLRVDTKTGNERMLLSNRAHAVQTDSGSKEHISLTDHYWLSTQNELIIDHDGDLFSYDFIAHKLHRLTSTVEPEELISPSPDGGWVAFVRENDIYVINVKTGREKQLTFDGEENLFNGKKDYVYQEELGERYDFKAYRWSPDSRYIAYLQTDDRLLPQYPLINYQSWHPVVEYLPYPLPGDPLPIVKIGIADISDGSNRWLNAGDEKNVYYPAFDWLPDSRRIAVQRLDRSQKHLDLLSCEIYTGECNWILSESDPFWINMGDFAYFLKLKDQFVWGSERSGFRHLYLYDYEGNLKAQLTGGNWAVTELSGVNEKSGYIFFVGNKDDHLERQIYRVDLDGRKIEKISQRSGEHIPDFAPNASGYIDMFSSTLTPPQISLHHQDGNMIRFLDENENPNLQLYDFVDHEFFTIRGSNGLVFNAFIMKPPDFDRAKKYPVLINIYGGPHSQKVRRKFTYLWHQLMAQQGYIIFVMDNRGSANRGREWENAIYRQLGKVELEDQLEGIKYLKDQSYVDESRIGMWGWSYGGYMVLYAMTHSKVFKAGASIAPVTDWRLYDCIYTERYMGLPAENHEGYEASSVLNSAAKLSGCLFIAHGLMDDNVHINHTGKFIDHLIDAGSSFQLHTYPEQNHGIKSTADRMHMFNEMTRFFLENL